MLTERYSVMMKLPNQYGNNCVIYSGTFVILKGTLELISWTDNVVAA